MWVIILIYALRAIYDILLNTKTTLVGTEYYTKCNGYSHITHNNGNRKQSRDKKR